MVYERVRLTFMAQDAGKWERNVTEQNGQVGMTNTDCVNLDVGFVGSQFIKYNFLDHWRYIHCAGNYRKAFASHDGDSQSCAQTSQVLCGSINYTVDGERCAYQFTLPVAKK